MLGVMPTVAHNSVAIQWARRLWWIGISTAAVGMLYKIFLYEPLVSKSAGAYTGALMMESVWYVLRILCIIQLLVGVAFLTVPRIRNSYMGTELVISGLALPILYGFVLRHLPSLKW